MDWGHAVFCFFGGAFLANGVPHYVAGVMGRPFQSPFAKPPGKGLSSSTVNVLWGAFNFVAAFLFLTRLGHFGLDSSSADLATGLGVLVMGLLLARSFGRFHGGDLTGKP